MNVSLTVAATVITVAAALRGTWSPCGLSMVSAINPLAERARGNRYWLTAVWFIAGAIAGGMALGLGGALLSYVLAPIGGHLTLALVIALFGCLIVLAADLRVFGIALPLHPRQLNELWLGRYRRWIYAGGFGMQVGTGFATYVMTAATYLLLLLAGLTGSPEFALLVGVLFGSVRGLAVLLSAGCRTPESLLRLHSRLHALDNPSRRGVMVVEASVLLLLGYALAGWIGLLVVAAVTMALFGVGASSISVRIQPAHGHRTLLR